MVPFWLAWAILRIRLVRQEKFRSLVASVSATEPPSSLRQLFWNIPEICFNQVWWEDRHGDSCFERRVYDYSSQEKGAYPSCRAPRGSTRVSQEAGERGESVDQTLLLNKDVVESCLVGMSPTEQEAKHRCWHLCWKVCNMNSVCCKTTGLVGSSRIMAHDFKIANHQLRTIKVD